MAEPARTDHDRNGESVQAKSLVSKSQTGSSTALVKPMGPPPPTKIVRPAIILSEETYTSALSHIIARDFFPGIAENNARQEYLDAVEAQDEEWIATASAELHRVVTEKGRGGTVKQRVTIIAADGTEKEEEADIDLGLSLSRFQSKYTSEDNESFYQVLDEQNKKKAAKYAFLHEGNKIARTRELLEREKAVRLLTDRESVAAIDGKEVKLITAPDERPAKPDAWNSRAKNGLMFVPDAVDSQLQYAAEADTAARAASAPKSINYANTRLRSDPYELGPVQLPGSPSLSTIRDAISGNPRRADSSVADTELPEFPTINGYSFVDPNGTPIPQRHASATPSPFSINDSSNREKLHNRMVGRSMAKKRHRDDGNVGSVSAATPTFTSFTPLGRSDALRGQATPGSPAAIAKAKVLGNMTPAARRLLSRVQQTPLRASTLSGIDGPSAFDNDGPMQRRRPDERWTPKIKKEPLD